MATFSDTFERANGPLGGNWYDPSSLYTIAGGYVSSSSNHGTYNTSLSDNSFLSATCHVLVGSHASRIAGPALKFSAASYDCYYAAVSYSSPNWTFTIYRYYGGVSTVLVSSTISPAPPPWCLIYLEWNLGSLSATLNDSLTITASDNALAAGVYGGFWQYFDVSKIADVFITSGSAVGLAVDPEVVGNYGECTELELTGTNTSWTPGTPGSPIFTVDHGTITAQTVNSATSATITYCPGDFLGTATITDPSTGETVSITVTSDPAIVPPEGPCPLTQAGADLLNDEAEIRPGGLVLTTLTPSLMDPPETLVQLITWIYLYMRGIVGGVPPEDPAAGILGNIQNVLGGAWEPDAFAYEPVNVQPVKADTDQILSLLNTLTTQYTDLADIVALLGGSPTVLSHQDLKTAIDNISGQIDLSAILDKLDSIQGSEVISITDLAGLINQIRTIAGYSLGDVLAAIQALNPATAPGLAAALATIMGSLGAIALEIAAIGAAETEDAAASSAGAVSAAAALAWLLANGPLILDMLHDVQDLLGSSGNAAPHPPVWPGLANVDLGDPVDLASTNTLAGPMHGVLLDITSADPGTNRYLYDTVPAWKNIGALSFFTDTGHHETYQALSFAQALYVPKTMAVAGGVRVFHGRGPEGTIRPWSYKT